ncbi:MAG TPA: Hsp70 family protein, partial [Acidobacteriaceae bacterium]
QQDQTDFTFRDHGFNLHASVTRTEFESWIQPDLAAIEQAIAEVMSSSGVAEISVDRVFLTGGSSLVPAVRRIFERSFGPDRIRAGDEFTSVASGLALRARATQRAHTV